MLACIIIVGAKKEKVQAVLLLPLQPGASYNGDGVEGGYTRQGLKYNEATLIEDWNSILIGEASPLLATHIPLLDGWRMF